MYKRFFLLLFPIIVSAQIPDKELLADQYYQQEEYDKAVILYEKLYQNKPGKPYLYKKYLNTLLHLNEYNEAEKLVKQQMKRYSDDLVYLIDLGFVYTRSNELSKARQQYDKVNKRLSSSQDVIRQVAAAFWAINEFDYAITTYQKGRKLLRNERLFSYELGKLYARKNEIDKMVNIYLDILSYQPQQEANIKNTFQDELKSDKDFKVLKSQLYSRIQKSPNNAVFVNILIWLLIQQNNFEEAFVQNKALHKRLNENGHRLLKFARIARSNSAFDVTVKAYEFVIKEGHRYYTLLAKKELLDVKKTQIIRYALPDQDAIIALEADYEAYLDEYGKNNNTAEAIRALADLEAYYLYNTDKATLILKKMIDNPAISDQEIALAKLELGDIYVVIDDMWEGMLLYMQVDKAFKGATIGDEARLKIAELAYYDGDFGWARAQLDVLKGSTTKLTANDALKRSIFIIDNTGLDTNTIPLSMYAKAELLEKQNKPEEAIRQLDVIVMTYPGHTLSDDILYKKVIIRTNQKRYDDAIGLLENIIDNYSHDLLGDDALFQLAELYQFKMKDNKKAQQYYQQLLIDHKDSVYSVVSRKRFRELRGDDLN